MGYTHSRTIYPLHHSEHSGAPMIDVVVDFFLFGPGRVVLPAFQGSFNMAYPANAPFPDQL
ncbi:hypothetical protein GCM10009832_29090 [Dietzia kunjamensis subsp. schimae]